VHRVFAVPGGLPVFAEGRVVAGVGVGGAPPPNCADLVRAVLS
jgi:uncharacterized protein GlcG (DUF336 family)